MIRYAFTYQLQNLNLFLFDGTHIFDFRISSGRVVFIHKVKCGGMDFFSFDSKTGASLRNGRQVSLVFWDSVQNFMRRFQCIKREKLRNQVSIPKSNILVELERKTGSFETLRSFSQWNGKVYLLFEVFSKYRASKLAGNQIKIKLLADSKLYHVKIDTDENDQGIDQVARLSENQKVTACKFKYLLCEVDAKDRRVNYQLVGSLFELRLQRVDADAVSFSFSLFYSEYLENAEFFDKYLQGRGKLKRQDSSSGCLKWTVSVKKQFKSLKESNYLRPYYFISHCRRPESLIERRVICPGFFKEQFALRGQQAGLHGILRGRLFKDRPRGSNDRH